jgi:sulfite exporter TauE/SafE
MLAMRLVSQLAETVFWMTLWTVIPAGLLYPCVVWLLKHTQYSVDALGLAYGFGIAILFFPTGFLTHFLYRKFILKRADSN